MAHGHTKSCCPHIHATNQDIKKISIVLIFIMMFFVVELWGHYKTGSLSLLADALHLFVDISGFVISIMTLRMTKKQSDHKMTFGYSRFEIIGALFSVFFIWTAIIYLVIKSFEKYMDPKEIDGQTFLHIAIIGLVVNIICMAVLHLQTGDKLQERTNLNMRATYIHIIGDIVQSIGVIIASIIIYNFPQFVIADVICTVFFALLVGFSTFTIVRDAISVLSEKAPSHIHQTNIRNQILSLDNVLKVTDLKVWSISMNMHAVAIKILTDHILIKEYEKILRSVKEILQKERNIEYIGIQIDTPGTNEESVGLEIGSVNFNA